jgi:hypothetical protein
MDSRGNLQGAAHRGKIASEQLQHPLWKVYLFHMERFQRAEGCFCGDSWLFFEPSELDSGTF